MHKQPLLGSSLGEVVTARWANEDPNPVAVAAQKRAAEVRPGGQVRGLEERAEEATTSRLAAVATARAWGP